MQFDTIEDALEAIRRGEMVVVVDDEDRENEGDLVMAAEKATKESINFMATYGRGLICLPMEKKNLEKIGVDEMVKENTDTFKTAFTVSIDAADTSTGISAYERAYTIRKAVDDDATPDDFKRPGHIFPLIAKEGGVLKRAGHTEASVDLARLAGLKPAGVICEIMNEDGSMARLPDLEAYVKRFGLKLISIADLIEYRKQRQDTMIKRAAESNLPTDHGDFRMV
ncbi:MAG: 3,4-dihydroxy-2-butanone-4-phosphate synthase, partial [Bacillota bacterium]